MDVSPYLDLKPAPRFIFDALAERMDRPRFMVPKGDAWTPITFGEYAQAIREVALYLHTDGLSPQGRVALFAPNRYEWAVAAQAAQAAGGVMVPIYPSNTASQAAYIVDHCDAEVVIVDTQPLLERVVEGWAAYDRVRRLICMSDDLDVAAAIASVKAKGKPVPDAAALDRCCVSWSTVVRQGRTVQAEDPQRFEALLDAVTLEQHGVMLYTSGTTGHPKGVPLTHRNFAVNHRDWIEVLGPLIAEHSTDVLWLPMSHMFGYGETFIGNALGWTSYLSSPQQALGLMQTVHPTAFMSVPAYWEKLAKTALKQSSLQERKAKLAEATGGNLTFCLSGGAGLKQQVKELFKECGILIIEGYGLTETSPTLTMNRPDDYRFDTVGKPFPSVDLKLAEDGEILARGPSVFMGYHKDPVATQGAFTPDGWFKTGDVGQWTEDGFLKIVDRKKDILVTAGGKNVPPANIELRFRDDALIEHLVVFGDGQKFLTAGVWLNEQAVETMMQARAVPLAARQAALVAEVQARINAVNEDLAHHEQLKKFQIVSQPLTVESGLITPTLKVRRKRVYDAFRSELEALYA